MTEVRSDGREAGLEEATSIFSAAEHLEIEGALASVDQVCRGVPGARGTVNDTGCRK